MKEEDGGGLTVSNISGIVIVHTPYSGGSPLTAPFFYSIKYTVSSVYFSSKWDTIYSTIQLQFVFPSR